jgi:hypothetical protein
MKRLLFPKIETLESRALLSHVAAGAAARHHQIADVATAAIASVPSNLSISLTTSQSSYTVGQQVQMTLTATNKTHHNVTVSVGPSIDFFSISENGQTIWRSNSGAQPHFVARRVVHPGQSFTLTANWTATTTGAFVVHNQLAPKGPVATFSVTANAPAPVSTPGATPVLDVSLTTNQSTYAVGQTVQMTMTATNDTGKPQTVWVGPNTNVFSITQNGKVVWQSDSGPQPLIATVARVLNPGQSLTLTASWTASATGTFTVSNNIVAAGPTATFNVVANTPPLKPPPVVTPPIDSPPVSNPPGTNPVGNLLGITLTTNQSSYLVGQTVQMTMQATNTSDKDVTIYVGATSNVFSLTEDGKIIWTSDSGNQPTDTIAEVLVPGQSITLKASWKATAVGTYVVSNSLDPIGPTATFSVKASGTTGAGGGGGGGGLGGGNA